MLERKNCMDPRDRWKLSVVVFDKVTRSPGCLGRNRILSLQEAVLGRTLSQWHHPVVEFVSFIRQGAGSKSRDVQQPDKPFFTLDFARGVGKNKKGHGRRGAVGRRCSTMGVARAEGRSVVWCFFRRGERGLERNWSGRVPVRCWPKARVHGEGKAKELGQATRPQSLISRGATHRRSNQHQHQHLDTGVRCRPGGRRQRQKGDFVAVPAPCGNESQHKHEPLFPSRPLSLHSRPTRQHAPRSRANLVETGDPTTVSRHTPGSPGSQTLCDSMQKARNIYRSPAGQTLSPRHRHRRDRSSIPFPNRHTLHAGCSPLSCRPQGCGFQLPALLSPAPRLQRSLHPPTSHFQRNHDNPTFPIRRKPWRGHQKRSCCLEAARISPYIRDRTGQVIQIPLGAGLSRGWGRGRSDLKRFCCARQDSPPERNRPHSILFRGVDIFGLPDLRRGLLGNGTLRASASQDLGAVLLNKPEGPGSGAGAGELVVPFRDRHPAGQSNHSSRCRWVLQVASSSRTLLPLRAVCQ